MAAGARVTVFPAQAIAEARAACGDGLFEIAGQIADDARSSAPVETGEFQSSISAQRSGNRASVIADDDRAIYIEYGTSDTPAHATMTNAARKFGKYTGMTPR
jgi:HK97 gp10 family phage protein